MSRLIYYVDLPFIKIPPEEVLNHTCLLRVLNYLQSYLFNALILNRSLEHLDRLIASVLEHHHYLIMQRVYIDTLMPILVCLHVHYLAQGESLDRLHTVERDAPHLQLVFQLIKNYRIYMTCQKE